jgi:hypothetical protein
MSCILWVAVTDVDILRNPCDTVACVVTQVIGARCEARTASELATWIVGNMSCQNCLVKTGSTLRTSNVCKSSSGLAPCLHYLELGPLGKNMKNLPSSKTLPIINVALHFRQNWIREEWQKYCNKSDHVIMQAKLRRTYTLTWSSNLFTGLNICTHYPIHTIQPNCVEKSMVIILTFKIRTWSRLNCKMLASSEEDCSAIKISQKLIGSMLKKNWWNKKNWRNCQNNLSCL